MSLKQFNLSAELFNYLDDKKITSFTKVQENVIPKFLKNQNMIVESPTGSGKTLSFLLPIFQNINPENGLQAIIFTPTKELANQIYNVAREIKQFKNLSLKKFDGSSDINRQEVEMAKNPNIIIGTPERILKIFDINSVNIKNLKYIIIDEADMMLDFGFLSMIDPFVRERIKHNNLVWGLFSATLPFELQNFIKNNLSLKNVLNINLIKEYDEKTIVNLVHIFDDNKDKTFLDLINDNRINPYFALVFAKTKAQVEHLYELMQKNGNKNLMMFTSDLTSRERKRVIKAVEQGKLVYLVTTDLIARGMDFPAVSHIINYSLPSNLNFYKHRIGRTDRENSIKGEIYDIYSVRDKSEYTQIQKKNPYITLTKWKK